MEHPQLQEILGKLKRHLELLYGDRLASLILFGSQARKEARTDSDIDALIVLTETTEIPAEREAVIDCLAALCLEYEVLVTCLWTGYEDWQTRRSPLMLNIRREGIVV